MKNRFFGLIYVIIAYHIALPAHSQVTWKQYNGPFSGEISSLAKYNDTLFIGSTLTGIFKSHDDGANWTHAIPELTYVHSLFDDGTRLLIGTDKLYSYTKSTTDLVQLGQEVYGAILYIHKMNGDLFVSTDYSIYKYDPATNTLVEKNNGLPDFGGIRWTRDLASFDSILYCNVLASGLYKSVDEGENWEKVNDMNDGYGYFSITTHQNSMYCIGNKNVFLSKDKAKTWSDIKYNLPPDGYLKIAIRGNKLFLTTVSGIYTLDEGSTEWKKVDNTLSYTLMVNGDLLFFSDGNGLYKWESSEFIPSNKGINTSRVNDMEVFSHKIYSGTHSGLHYTTPGSDDWQLVPEFKGHFVMAVKKSESDLWIGSSKGLYTRSQANEDFHRVTGIPEVPVRDIEIVKKRIFVATDNGVYVSYNEGNTWNLLPNSVSPPLFTLSANESMLVAGNNHGLFKILPDSSNWEKIEFFTDYIVSLNIINGIIYSGQMNSSIYRSLDYGATWKWSGIDGYNTLDMLKRGNNIYAATYNKIYYSSNNGSTWSSFYETGIPSVMINCIAEGENDFYVGTYGKSVWYRSFINRNEIESDVYAIENDTIYNIDPATTLAEFQENVSVSYGAWVELETINESGKVSSPTEYVGLNRVKIIAEDGISVRVLNVKGAPGVPEEPGVITDVHETENLTIEIYPVPTDDKLFMKRPEWVASWQIINGVGHRMPQQELRNDYIDVSQLPNGIYFLLVRDTAGRSQTVKFVKK